MGKTLCVLLTLKSHCQKWSHGPNPTTKATRSTILPRTQNEGYLEYLTFAWTPFPTVNSNSHFYLFLCPICLVQSSFLLKLYVIILKLNYLGSNPGWIFTSCVALSKLSILSIPHFAYL